MPNLNVTALLKILMQNVENSAGIMRNCKTKNFHYHVFLKNATLDLICIWKCQLATPVSGCHHSYHRIYITEVLTSYELIFPVTP